MGDKVVILVKDEDDFIVDCIVHHLALGFDGIIVFDDLSDVPVATLVAALPEAVASRVTCHRFQLDFYRWHGHNIDPLFDAELYSRFASTKQMYVYNYALAHCLDATDWCAFVDADEFIWLGEQTTLAAFRRSIQDRGYSAVVFDMLLYGHSFRVLPEQPRNVASFLWCDEEYHGHGKFYAHVGAIREIRDAHFPTLGSAGLVADALGQVRTVPSKPNVRRHATNAHVPHLKHFIIQDIYTCFRRRVRPRISSAHPMSHRNRSWIDRAGMLERTSRAVDFDLAISLLRDRKNLGLDITQHAGVFSQSLSDIPLADRLSAELDYGFLRDMMRPDTEIDDLELLFAFFSMPNPDRTWLRLRQLPPDFDPATYCALNPDLVVFSTRGLIKHYLHHGRDEGRRYKVVPAAEMQSTRVDDPDATYFNV